MLGYLPVRQRDPGSDLALLGPRHRALVHGGDRLDLVLGPRRGRGLPAALRRGGPVGGPRRGRTRSRSTRSRRGRRRLRWPGGWRSVRALAVLGARRSSCSSSWPARGTSAAEPWPRRRAAGAWSRRPWRWSWPDGPGSWRRSAIAVAVVGGHAGRCSSPAPIARRDRGRRRRPGRADPRAVVAGRRRGGAVDRAPGGALGSRSPAPSRARSPPGSCSGWRSRPGSRSCSASRS